jgi:hypothetical protein
MLKNFGNQRIPYLSLGTSPFIGAGQFGPRASKWYHQFFHNIDAMAELMAAGCHIAPPGGVHVIAYPTMIAAARKVQETHELIVTSSLTADDPLESLDRLSSLDSAVIFLHGSLVDQAVPKSNSDILLPLIEQIRSLGALPGLASHKPIALLEWLSNHKLPEPFGLLLPINATGWGVDGPVERLLSLMQNLEQPVMAMKPLAAGTLPPDNAFSWLAKHKKISAITAGAISIEQIQTNLELIKRLMKNK